MSKEDYNRIKSEFSKYVVNSPEFKLMNSRLDKKTNYGEDFEVDQEEQYSILLYDVEILIDDIKDRLPDNTEYIIVYIYSDFMSYDITLKCYIDGKFEDVDENNWKELLGVIYDNSDYLMSEYETAIASITYTDWLEIKKKTKGVILDINESIDNDTIKKEFIKFVVSLPDYRERNEKLFDGREIHQTIYGYYYMDLFSADILKPIYNYPGKTEVPNNISYFIISYYQDWDNFEKDFYVYDINDGFRVPTKEEKEFIIKNDRSQQFSLLNFKPIFSLNHDDWYENRKKVYSLFRDINENNHEELPNDVKKAFVNFIKNDFNKVNISIDKSIEEGEYIEDEDVYNNECWLLDFYDINDRLDNGNIYNRYIIKSKFHDDYETITSYYHFIDGKFIDIIEHYDDNDELEYGEKFGSGYQYVYDVILYYSYSEYKKMNKKIETFFRKINENVGSNFEEAKKEFLKIVYDIYKSYGNDYKEYELFRKEGLYVILIIGKMNGKKFYYDYGYIYGRNGWEYFDDMEHIVKYKDQLEKVMGFNFNDYDKVKDRQERFFRDINELKSNRKYIKGKSETLLGWISMKLQHKIGKRIGRGIEGVVYQYSKGKVIKITTEDIVQQYELLNKDIKGIVKIYHTGLIEVPKRFFEEGIKDEVNIGGESKVKGFNDFSNTKHSIEVYSKYIGYIIMEEVDTSVNDRLDNVVLGLSDLLLSYSDDENTYIDKLPEDFREIIKRNYTSDFRNIERHDMFNIINLLSNKNPIHLKKWLSKYFELDPIIYELIDVLYNIRKYYDWIDIHSGQFGINSKGELVAFDISNDDDKFGQSLGLYPTPKNIIKESYISPSLPNDIKKSFFEFIHHILNKEIYKIDGSDSEIIDINCWLILVDDLFPNDDSQYVIKIKKTLSEPDGFDNTDVKEYYFYDHIESKFNSIDYSYYWEDLEEYDIYSAPLEQNYDVLGIYNYDDYRKLEDKRKKLFYDINEKLIISFSKFKSRI